MKLTKKSLFPMFKKQKLFLLIMFGLFLMAFMISFITVRSSVQNAREDFKEDLGKKASFLAGIIHNQEDLGKEKMAYINIYFLITLVWIGVML